jgi:hypothetical protein
MIELQFQGLKNGLGFRLIQFIVIQRKMSHMINESFVSPDRHINGYAEYNEKRQQCENGHPIDVAGAG